MRVFFIRKRMMMSATYFIDRDRNDIWRLCRGLPRSWVQADLRYPRK